MATRNAPNPGPPQGGAESHYALRFISGKYQGGEFPLNEGQEIVIGRSSDLDMVLVEEMVSRRHARIALERGVISIEDLGSTNGTFVNGEKVQRGTLKEGDRVLIGTNILRVISTRDGVLRDSRIPAKITTRHAPTRSGEEAPRMSGSLEEIPLPDLLQLFGTSRKAGVLVLRSENREGRIFLNEGRIRFSHIEGSPTLGPLKAVYRMLEWRTGLFELDPPDNRSFPSQIDVSAQEVLMEGFRQQDELRQIRDRLPSLETRLVLRLPLGAPLRELEPVELDLLELVLHLPNLAAVFDNAASPDLETAQGLAKLVARGYVEPMR
jgi:Domain of unknown function (DUF4388)/FHA domain